MKLGMTFGLLVVFALGACNKATRDPISTDDIDFAQMELRRQEKVIACTKKAGFEGTHLLQQ